MLEEGDSQLERLSKDSSQFSFLVLHHFCLLSLITPELKESLDPQSTIPPCAQQLQ